MNILNRDYFKPLYLQVVDYLVQNIRDQTWPVGSLIPSETQLVENFKISRNTARQALNELVQRGYVYRITGKGTFVAASPLDQRYNFLSGFSSDVRSLGLTPGHKNLEIKTMPASPIVAAKLHIAPETEVIYLHRLLLANDLPHIVVKTHIPLRWLELQQIALNEETLGTCSFYEWLGERGIVFTSAVTNIRADIASAEDARLLGLRKGSPVLHSERVSKTEDDVPREYTLGIGHPSRHQLTMISYNNG